MRRHLLLFVLIVGVVAGANSTSASGAPVRAHAATATTAKAAKAKRVKKCRTRTVRRGNGRVARVRRCVWVTPKRKRPSSSGTPVVTSAPVADPSGLRAAVRECANTERAKVGLPPLADDITLDRAAQGHAEDMAERGFFSHDTPEGRTPWDRIAAALLGATPFSVMGENIAMGFRDVDATCVGWMNSPGHRANILDPDFHLIGTAWVDGYAVQDFGSR